MTRNKIIHYKLHKCIISVYINGSTSNGPNDSMNITCTVLGLTTFDLFEFEIELHRRRNFNIIRLVKSTPERLQQTTDKFCWSTSLTEDNITLTYNATVHLYVLSKYNVHINLFISLITSFRLLGEYV